MRLVRAILESPKSAQIDHGTAPQDSGQQVHHKIHTTPLPTETRIQSVAFDLIFGVGCDFLG